MSEKIREIVDRAIEDGSKQFDSLFGVNRKDFTRSSQSELRNIGKDAREIKRRILRIIRSCIQDVDWTKKDAVENLCMKLNAEINHISNYRTFVKTFETCTKEKPNVRWDRFERWIDNIRKKTKQEIFNEIDQIERRENVDTEVVSQQQDHEDDPFFSNEEGEEESFEPARIISPSDIFEQEQMQDNVSREDPETLVVDSLENEQRTTVPFLMRSEVDGYLELLSDPNRTSEAMQLLVDERESGTIEAVILSLLEQVKRYKKDAHDAEELWEQAEAQNTSSSEADRLKDLLSLTEASVAEKQKTIADITTELTLLKKEIEKNNQIIEKFQAQVVHLQHYAENVEASSAITENRLKTVKIELQHQTPNVLFNVIELLDTQLSEVISERRKQRKEFELEIKEKTRLLEYRTRKMEEYKKQIEQVMVQLQKLQKVDVPVVEVSSFEFVDSTQSENEEGEMGDSVQEQIEKLNEELDFALEMAGEYETEMREHQTQIKSLELVIHHLRAENENLRASGVKIPEQNLSHVESKKESVDDMIHKRREELLEKIEEVDSVLSNIGIDRRSVLERIRFVDGETSLLLDEETRLDSLKELIEVEDGRSVFEKLRETREKILLYEKEKGVLHKRYDVIDASENTAQKIKSDLLRHLQALGLISSPIPEVPLGIFSSVEPGPIFSRQLPGFQISEIEKNFADPLTPVMEKERVHVPTGEKIHVEGLPFSVEYSLEEQKSVQEFEQWIQSFRGRDRLLIESEFVFDEPQPNQKIQSGKESPFVVDPKYLKDRYDELIIGLQDGTFLGKFKFAIAILGATRGRDGSFVARFGKNIGELLCAKTVRLSPGLRDANERTSHLYTVVKYFPSSERIISRRTIPGQMGKINILTDLGKAASQVWLKECLDSGKLRAAQVKSLWSEANDRAEKAKERALEKKQKAKE